MATNNKDIKPMSFQNNVADEWKWWKQRFQINLIATGREKESERVKIAIFLNSIGDEGIAIYNTLPDRENADITLDKIINEFEKQCAPIKNTTMETFKFNNLIQKSGQSIESYFNELRTQAKLCEFTCECKNSFQDRMIKDRLVVSVLDKTCRDKFLREPNLKLSEMVQFCKVVEEGKNYKKLLDCVKNKEDASINTVVQSKISGETNYKPTNNYVQCGRCGNKHHKRKCPAYGKICAACKGKNHFAKHCKFNVQMSHQQQMPQKRHVIRGLEAEEREPDTEVYNVVTIQMMENVMSTANSIWYEEIKVGDQFIKFKLDTGADISVIPLNLLNTKIAIEKHNLKLKCYGDFVIKPIGVCYLPINVNKISKQIEFAVVKEKLEPLLSGQACLELGLIKKINTICNLESDIKSEQDFINANIKQFSGLGTIPGEYKIKLKNNYIGIVNANRRVPFGLHDRLESTLNDLEARKIISKVDYPTDFVNSLIIVEKPNGSLRICIDPKHLNTQIQREHYTIPTSDDITSRLVGKSVFTVIDLKEGFWQIKLDEESTNLCCFSTPFGRYKFLRMPFGISVAPEVFQKKMVQIFGGISNVDVYFDDLIITGRDEKEHDIAMNEVIKTAIKYNVRFNPQKLQYKKPLVSFMGMVISKEGIKPSPKHIRAIKELETPKDKKELLRILGIFKFLSKFMNNMSQNTACLRELTKNDALFIWKEEHDKALDKLKNEITVEPVLAFFNCDKPICIQTDASKDGIGCCLLQDGQPIAFASRAMTNTEKRYAQIEKELLAVVFSVDKFHQFIYGKKFKVHSDHKPLVSIAKKDINKVTSRLQRMILRLLKYDYEIEYIPGKEMYIADALSRSYIKDPVEDDPEMLYVVNALSQNISISDSKRIEFELAYEKDEILSKVIEFKKVNCWTKNKNPELKHYHKIKDDIFISNKLMFLNDKLIIPTCLRKYILELMHEGHIGIDKTIIKARQNFYWPSMVKDITEYNSSCYSCQKYRKSNCKEPLQPYPVTERPWQRIAADIFEVEGASYIVMIDSYSNWIELARIENKTAQTVILVLKDVFSRMGIPDSLVTDNNPFNHYLFKQFSEDYGFKHITSSPRYPKSNGLAEKGVNITKNIVKKSRSIDEMRIGLMEYRNTPLKTIGYSPAELLMSRRLKTKLPCNTTTLQPQSINHNDVRNKLKFRQNQQTKYYNRSSKKLPVLQVNENILLKKDKIWVPAIVVKCLDYNSYLVKDDEGHTYKRNRVFLSKTLVKYRIRDDLEIDSELLIDTYKFRDGSDVGESFGAENVTNENLNNEDVINENVTNENLNNEDVINENVINENVINENVTNENVINENVFNENVINENFKNEYVKLSSRGRKCNIPKYLNDYECENN